MGFALYFFTFSTFTGRPTLYLEDLFVVPQERRGGIGSRLLTRLAQIAMERGCGRMEWSVLDWNTPARDLYFKLGARAMEDWTVFRMTPEAFGRLAREGVPGGHRAVAGSAPDFDLTAPPECAYDSVDPIFGHLEEGRR